MNRTDGEHLRTWEQEGGPYEEYKNTEETDKKRDGKTVKAKESSSFYRGTFMLHRPGPVCNGHCQVPGAYDPAV